MNRNERTNQTIGIIALCAALAATGAEAALSTSKSVNSVTRSSSSVAEQISGITWAGGNLYYAVDDNDKKLYPLTIEINSSSGEITSHSIGTGVSMTSANDMEGCAYDPCSGNVWVSQESGPYIREYNPNTGAIVKTSPVPAIQKQYYGNFSLEALTISGDGKTMWTANEEALKVDGTNSTKSAGSVVRLTRLVRDSVYDNWTPNGEWAYLTQPVGSDPWIYNGDVKTRSGVAGLCALPDGTLLVLERNLCGDNWLDATFYNRIYAIAPSEFSAAKDVSGIASLKTASSYTKVTKTSLFNKEVGWVNYEGICLGPRLDDGSCVLILVADGGNCTCKLGTLTLSGIDVKKMSFDGPTGCEPFGGPYRYVSGVPVTAMLPGAGNPYEENQVVHSSWIMSNSMQKGEGSVANFTVSANEDTLTWLMKTNATLPILEADSFEHVALGTTANPSDLPGWSGGEDGYVAAKSYSPALPPGYPLNRETHTQVLEVDGNVTRTYDTSIAGGVILDTMVRATLPTPDSPVTDNTDCFIAFHFDEQGHPMLQHGDRNGNAIRARARSGAGGNDPVRTVLSENTYTNGQWLRLTIKVDRPSGTWCHVSIDGSACVTSGGAYQPGSNPQMDGAWYRALSTNEVISAIELKGTGAVDDVTLFTPTANDPNSEFPEFKVTDENDNRLPNADFYEWLNENGLPLDPNADVDGDGFSSLKEYQKGTDPWDKSSHPVIPTVFFGK